MNTFVNAFCDIFWKHIFDPLCVRKQAFCAKMYCPKGAMGMKKPVERKLRMGNCDYHWFCKGCIFVSSLIFQQLVPLQYQGIKYNANISGLFTTIYHISRVSCQKGPICHVGPFGRIPSIYSLCILKREDAESPHVDRGHWGPYSQYKLCNIYIYKYIYIHLLNNWK